MVDRKAVHRREGLVRPLVSPTRSDVGAGCLHGLVKFLRATARDEDVGSKDCAATASSVGF
jgi:hypothetical protein